jgi:hypothetical protein
MAHYIFPGDFVAPLDSLQPVALYVPPFYTYRITGFVDIASTNTLTQFDLVTPSVNNTNPDKVYTAGLSIPAGAWVRRRAIRIPSTNTAGKAATLAGTTGNRLVLGTGNTDSTAGNMVQAASSAYAAGGYRIDTIAPTALGAAAALRLYVATTGNDGAGAAPTASTGTIRVLWEVVYQTSADVVTIDEIPNATK